MTAFGNPSYGITRTLTTTDFDTAVEQVTAALAEKGFGIITTIDVKETFKKKLDVDRAPYTILGACNPKLAHRAIEAELPIGLLLPCNVVVADVDGKIVVSALDPEKMFTLVGRDDVAPIAEEVRGLMNEALESLS